jgi:CBS domain-containing protein
MHAKGVKTMSEKLVATQRARAPTSLKAKDVMQQPVIAATPRASLRDVASQIIKYEFSGMPVAEPDGKVLGVITEADIVFSLIDGHRLEAVAAVNFMTSPPVTVDVETSLEEVMRTPAGAPHRPGAGNRAG